MDVVVTGTRASIPIEKLSSSVKVIDSLELEQLNGVSIGDKIKNSTGLSLRSYGGNGALHSVSFRGLGSDYSLILIDGQRFTTYQISTVDVGIFQANEIERIEVASGGSSSQYGADAVGGVINIVTKRPDGHWFVSLSNTLGSYGLSGFQVSAGGGDEAFSYRGGIDLKRGANAFRFHFDDGTGVQTLRRNGADYVMRNYSFSASSIFTDDVAAHYIVRYSNADRGQPAAVTNSHQNNQGRINDHDLFMNSTTEIRLLEEMLLTLPVAYHYNRQTFFDPDASTIGNTVKSYYENNILGVSPLFRYSVSEEHYIVAGAELSRASINSNEVFPSHREQTSGFISSEHHFRLLTDFILFPSVRFDSFSDTKGDISPKIGINIGVLDIPSVRIRASYGKNFRVPTFNDLYWISGGNPKLTPERSRNFDAGLIAGIQSDEIDASVELTYFSIDAADKIVWRPVSGTIWSPVNLQSVTSKGFEGSAKLNLWKNLLIVSYSHNILRTRKTSEDFPGDAAKNKFLPYVPKEFSSFTLGTAWESLSANLTYSFTGFRYETSDNNPRFFLPTYDNIDANISYGFAAAGYSFRVRAEVNNLGNTDILLIRGYPMPLCNYSVTSTVSL